MTTLNIAQQQVVKASNLFERGETCEALACLRRALMSEPNHLGALLSLAVISYYQDHFGSAIRYLRMVIRRDKKNITALRYMVRCQMALLHYDEAIDYLQQIRLISNPPDPTVYHNLGMCYLTLGKMVEAEQNFNEAYEIAPADERSVLYKALFEKDRGEIVTAIRILETALLNLPDSLEILEHLGQLYFEAGKLQKAFRVFQKITMELPEDSNCHYYLGLILTERQNWSQARRAFEKALECEPDSPWILRQMAWVYHHLRQEKKAIATLEDALRLEPGDVELQTDLGYIYFFQGQLDQAIAIWRQVLKSEPTCYLLRTNLKLARKHAKNQKQSTLPSATIIPTIMCPCRSGETYRDCCQQLSKLGRLQTEAVVDLAEIRRAADITRKRIHQAIFQGYASLRRYDLTEAMREMHKAESLANGELRF